MKNENNREENEESCQKYVNNSYFYLFIAWIIVQNLESKLLYYTHDCWGHPKEIMFMREKFALRRLGS